MTTIIEAATRDDDARFMAAALALGRRNSGLTSPNPSVGALVVNQGLIVGRGVTAPGGRPHGETIAIAQAGACARGATIYVTLEPCAHHGVTSPCCEAIVAAGIGRVVYAIDDPNPNVAGRGAAFCRAHGLDVASGPGADAARRDHRGHILRMTARRPMVTLKLAETADGFVAGGPHDPRLAITGVTANGYVHIQRARHDAIMIGIGTAVADDPLMTVRLPGLDAKPMRIILDACLRFSSRSRVALTASEAPVLILTAKPGSDPGHTMIKNIEAVNVETVPGRPDGRIDLRAALEHLAARDITRVFSEGGPTIGSALITEGLADNVLLLRAPKPLGYDGIATMSVEARAVLADPSRYHLRETLMLGLDRLDHYERLF